MDLIEHARRYIAAAPGAVSGQGGHNQTLAVACALVKGFDLSIGEARGLLREYNGRCAPEWTEAELEHKLQSADTLPDTDANGAYRERGWLRADRGENDYRDRPQTRQAEAAPPPPKPEFRETKLQKFAGPWRAFVDTAWLADRSALDPYGMTSQDFCRALYRDGEKLVVFTEEFTQGQALWPADPLPTTGPLGVWFLCQPVDGEYHENPRNLDEHNKPTFSRRAEESVTSWRYLVIESDKARAKDWLCALVQLPLCVAAIYTSGSRSIHALIRVDAPSLHEWRDFSRQIKSILVTLGADQQVIATAVRLTRLPGAWREGKMIEEEKSGKKIKCYSRFAEPQLQKLLYVNPDPNPEPICTLKPLRDVLAPYAEMLLDSATLIERAGARDLNEVIAALGKRRPLAADECRRALKWFESSKKARDLLVKFNTA